MHSILLSKDDHNRLKGLINKYESLDSLSVEFKGYISSLKEKLNQAQILEDGDIKLIDTVTMNSSVRFKNLSTKEEKEYLIVYPQLECKNLGRISVFSDLGIALLGHKKGSNVEVKTSNGWEYKVQILDIILTSMDWIRRLEEQCKK
jgi:regulator of nucleoside diphosphate kinase